MNDSLLSQLQVDRIIKALDGLKYGSVLITVHDEQIVQIDRTEKHRFSVESPRLSKRSSVRRPQK
ncbi:hypothetical protein GCM10011571_29530 [Marinithermofilum abyssi]|uniref:DUF2292 domain-containing protein n=1 Tax=Marinithermofilum abyssi TaxID=1571185 RepID=A0A8J2YDD7_9BACL|nr:YezD family protein [Marinithermofilum abyssi]GGE25455.1 hypothetical protein GCM10011571_29530 [Marinithermofilum abyssi]